MQGKVEICGVNTAKLRTLKPGECEALLRRSRAGDRAAREQLIEGNLRLPSLPVVRRKNLKNCKEKPCFFYCFDI